eukprot:CAMPEP_0177389890 /NCGR_PEP_ID=MMETSP0368-20130122/52838_1 /TAXON_ID=447022 ORGANISM="Scrippsiella hangoei-like, Strain SHHI-4" /NCGR_SAMPLE_ID=MMETSP0368 /ASSEMBLY_ACC=CAM_ASM_000363 /LENGTH=78 /DNA_ID=CAMNT_0018855395 /DNA_START=30 /DNA_END=263 /DNA_ORIENTATION=+
MHIARINGDGPGCLYMAVSPMRDLTKGSSGTTPRRHLCRRWSRIRHEKNRLLDLALRMPSHLGDPQGCPIWGVYPPDG